MLKKLKFIVVIVMGGDYKECINGLMKEAENQPLEIIKCQ